jgi:hypothetical protein
LAAEAVSGGGVDQAYDGWWVVSEIEFQQRVESGHSLKPPEYASAPSRNESA